MNRGNLSRRGFLANTLGGLVAAGVPLWFAKESVIDAQEKDAKKTPAGANDRIVMAAIGTGTNRTAPGQRRPPRRTRRRHHAERHAPRTACRSSPSAMSIAPMPSSPQNLVRTATRGGSRDCAIFRDFRELLEDRDINAVTIGTPDHWHALIAIAAMRAGKDVYCEKPMTLTIEEGKTWCAWPGETGKILQTGTPAAHRVRRPLPSGRRAGPQRPHRPGQARHHADRHQSGRRPVPRGGRARRAQLGLLARADGPGRLRPANAAITNSAGGTNTPAAR